MPSIGHVAVGLAAGRWRARARPDGGPRLVPLVAFLFLATFPDADAWARRLGAGPGSSWLHRGALHSLLVAAGAALAVGLVLDGRRLRAGTLLAAFATAASHGLLDTITHGGAGVMLLWPLSPARWLAPWTPLPASPMGARILSARGLAVMGAELLFFTPFVLYALWPRIRRRPVAAVGLGAADPPS